MIFGHETEPARAFQEYRLPLPTSKGHRMASSRVKNTSLIQKQKETNTLSKEAIAKCKEEALCRRVSFTKTKDDFALPSFDFAKTSFSMATNVNYSVVLDDSEKIEKVWSKNTSMTLGSDTDPKNPKVTHVEFLASKTSVEALDKQITDLRSQLDELLDDRNDGTKILSAYNTRALSAIRGIFGPDSSEYEQAGGTRSSERKKPVRKPKTT